MGIGSSPIHELFSTKTAHETRKNEKKIFREPFCRLLAHDGVKGKHPSQTQIVRSLAWLRRISKQKQRKEKQNVI
jgi:hypothetical protein